jgi:hypothetical protein
VNAVTTFKYCRHIDTAEFYANQRGIADGIKQSGVAREDIFITDKLSPGGIFGQPAKTYQDTIDSCKHTLELLQTSYLDLYLIHHPGAVAERLDQWRALLDLQTQGLVKHVGVSNYSIKHLEEIKVSYWRKAVSNAKINDNNGVVRLRGCGLRRRIRSRSTRCAPRLRCSPTCARAESRLSHTARSPLPPPGGPTQGRGRPRRQSTPPTQRRWQS